MKCDSIACIWSGAPLLHRVTATAVLNRPPTLYTGGSDGSIIWWNPSVNQSNREIWPVAMLCGHTAPIADLDICSPVAVGVHGEVEKSSNVVANSSSAGYGALISACTDGVLCIWSRGSGHCRRRRKMSPWVGSPSTIRTLPGSPRYVCIACCCTDSVHASHHQSADPAEGVEASADQEYQYKKDLKCAVVIVDSYSLSIVQTVFRGSLSAGPLKFMAVIPSIEDRDKQSVFMVDGLGIVQSVIASKESGPDGEGGSGLQRSSSHIGMSSWEDEFGKGVQGISIATRGNLLALVYKTNCIFRLVTGGNSIGEISLIDTPLCDEGISSQSHLVGGMFLDIGGRDTLDRQDPPEAFSENFAVWSNRGAVLVYTVSGSSNTFKFELLCEIPAVSYPIGVRLSINVCQLGNKLLRVESISYSVEESSLWKPYITIWSLCETYDANGNWSQQCKMIGRGDFIGDWIGSTSSLSEPHILNYDSLTETIKGKIEINSQYSSTPSLSNLNGLNRECHSNDLVLKGRTVSSSMVLTEDFYAPYGIVCGFYSGEIEVVHFKMLFQEHDPVEGSSCHKVETRVSKQFLSGHSGAVLCLAAKHVDGASNERGCSRILLSGSMDCTICIWDLDTSNVIIVMHHHVAPVRQLILPPPGTNHPWSNCFLSVGEDSCVALASVETLRVERMFPGHPNYPSSVVWDGARGYIACLCKNDSGISDSIDVLYLWDVKTGARERVIRGMASRAVFDHFYRAIGVNSTMGNLLTGATSVSSLHLPIIEDARCSLSHVKNIEKRGTSVDTGQKISMDLTDSNILPAYGIKGKAAKQISSPLVFQNNKHPIKCYCPYPGIATLRFDLLSLMSPCEEHTQFSDSDGKQENARPETASSLNANPNDMTDIEKTLCNSIEEHAWVRSLEGCLLRFSLSFLHLWGIDDDLDRLLISGMNISRPENFVIASGLQGDRGSVTLTFPGLDAALELWRSSSEFCAMRSLTMVSLAQRMISLSRSSSAASSALSAFYTRNFAEKIPDIKPPLLQLLVSFWQDESEHVRMAARSLFHCAASRAIPLPLSAQKATQHEICYTHDTLRSSFLDSERIEKEETSQVEESSILAWLESFEMQDWTSCVGGTSQDGMASHIIVAAALVVWYPSLVKPRLATLVVHPLIKLVMAMNGKYSSTAAELLAEGMEGTWKVCIGPEISRLIGDIFFQVECLTGVSANPSIQNPALAVSIQESLVGVLLPSLAIADIPGFLNVIESQIWSTASDSPVHLASLLTLIRVIRGSPKSLAQYLDKVVSFILRTMDPGNSIMCKACLKSSMAALKEVVRMFPMVALNETLTRLAVGDAIGHINNVTIRVYDMQSVTKIKILDASGPPGLPSLLPGASETLITTGISALSFSPDGEGLVAFSENGLMIRWWSLGSAWWEKLSRNLVPVQCTKVIFVPPWEGFLPNSSRSSIIANIMGNVKQVNSQDKRGGLSDIDSLKLLIHNLDLSYRLEWVDARQVRLVRHGHNLGSFHL
ncbi:PREDICTED: uncharacterized protein LOC104590355 isoform X2 [Nelumbo nucifera]|uniref:WD repeat-containing protein 7 n=2 Tax=Nelumbo nucifera TaxID=4432 RepID=A0A822ZUT7_NELNU|nr:PREDICTED: uncharacterized protein LOC104590355 isoform X2 [Nelumbo nucifera]DAD47115.1 TPA_asm: hypothetical protein HUJ06_017052 [Nelumbo nucifera]